MSLIQELIDREQVVQFNHLDKLLELDSREKLCLYTGFDPTADSLHVGNLIPLMGLLRAKRNGCRVIALLGGATAMIGDPSGKTEMRTLLSDDTIQKNKESIRNQISNFLGVDEDVLILDNIEWLGKLNYLQLLRDIGIHFSVNRMLTAECFKTKMERGLGFSEFNYMILQSYDFLELTRKYGCLLQLGGDDQWSNMLAGIELIRRVIGIQSYVLTYPLLTTSDGRKMGKTEKGAIWLSPEKTSPYEYYQYWRSIPDDKVECCLKCFTFLPINEINNLISKDINLAKEVLACETTEILHGKKNSESCKIMSRASAGVEGGKENMPTITLSSEEYIEGISIVDLLRKSELVDSNKEARRLIEGGGIQLENKRITDNKLVISKEQLSRGIELSRGKKQRVYIIFS